MALTIESFGQTDIGLKRKINQDAYIKDDSLGLYVVADGMGGHKGGEVASRLCVETVKEYLSDNPSEPARDVLNNGINKSCEAIYRASRESEELAGMGTTVVALYFKDGAVHIGQVGDSRVYMMNTDGIWQITEDHSLLNEEIRAGRIAANQVAAYQFKNVITRSVGYESAVSVDIYHRQVKVDDTFLLCTDGLSGLVNIKEMWEHVYQDGMANGLQNLVRLANSRGGDDNITAVVCRVASL